MLILSIFVILLLKECRGTLGSAVNEAYFALFSMGGHLGGLTPYVFHSDSSNGSFSHYKTHYETIGKLLGLL